MPAADTRRVLLVHGLWLHGASMRWLGARLREAGFEPREFSYASVGGGPDAAVPRLVDAIGTTPTHLVAHSLGGLVALTALREARLPVPRLVCLGSPLCGSGAARDLGRRAWTAPVLGRSGGLLQAGCPPWEGTVPVGMVAGNVARGIGRLITRFGGESDGTVALEETRLPGLAAHCVVPASHTGLVFSAHAARQAAHFLREGRFDNGP